MKEEKSTFEVTDHIEITSRGAFLVGHIRSGAFHEGMKLNSDNNSPLTIAGIEFADNVGEKKFWNAFRFYEPVDLGTLKEQFPVGTIAESIKNIS